MDAEYYRQWRAKHPEREAAKCRRYSLRHPNEHYQRVKAYRLANREKYNAHRAVWRAIKRGQLIRLPCQNCGNPKTHAHHSDYAKQLDVTWLCAVCHHEAHRKNMHTKNKTLKASGKPELPTTYDDEHADSMDCPYRMIYTTVAENGAEEHHSVGCDDLRDAMELAAMVYPDRRIEEGVGEWNIIDDTNEGIVVARIVKNANRLEQIMAERNVLLAALQRIGESTMAWRDEEANALIEGIGIIANNAVNQVFQMEGMNQ